MDIPKNLIPKKDLEQKTKNLLEGKTKNVWQESTKDPTHNVIYSTLSLENLSKCNLPEDSLELIRFNYFDSKERKFEMYYYHPTKKISFYNVLLKNEEGFFQNLKEYYLLTKLLRRLLNYTGSSIKKFRGFHTYNKSKSFSISVKPQKLINIQILLLDKLHSKSTPIKIRDTIFKGLTKEEFEVSKMPKPDDLIVQHIQVEY